MLGFSPISANPFAALSGGVSFDSDIDEAAASLEVVSSQNFLGNSVSESVTSTDVVEVAASDFSVVVEDSSVADDAASAVATFIGSVEELAQAVESVVSTLEMQGIIAEAIATLDVASAAADLSATINETSTGTDTTAALAAFISSVVESGVASEIVNGSLVVSSIVNESSTTQDSIVATASIQLFVSELLNVSDTTFVAPSTFNAAVSEEVDAVAQFLAVVTFIASIQEGAQAADQLLARLLWELVNDNQTANWLNANTSQNTQWGLVNDSQPVNWNDIPNQT